MKFLASLLSSSLASHFRAGSYQYRHDGTDLFVTRTLGWHHGSDGYSGCDQTDIDNQVLSASSDSSETVYDMAGNILMSPKSVPATNADYIVTEMDISANLASSSHYCFGYVEEEIAVSQPFRHEIANCCIITMEDDNGNSPTTSNFKVQATVYDWANNSPSFKITPIWYIMTDCPDQSLYLNPTDLDAGDTIKCRWATADEAEGMSHSHGDYDSLVLDENLCKISYDPTVDNFASGIKPIAIQVEDFDASGNIRSSMPAQFMATVWDPSTTSRLLGGKFFEGVFEDSSDDHGLHRSRRQALPDHCDGIPTWTGTTPKDGEVISVSGSMSIDWFAEYTNDDGTFVDMDRINFSGPTGMVCTVVDKLLGKSTCTWSPTPTQIAQKLHSLCAVAYDPQQRTTERRCVTLDAKAAPVPKPSTDPLSCWHCDASTMADCYNIGMTKPCMENSQVCMIEVRKRGGDMESVCMGCKSPVACDDNKKQNFIGKWSNRQCKPWEWTKGPSVCRQCCNGDDGCATDFMDGNSGNGPLTTQGWKEDLTV